MSAGVFLLVVIAGAIGQFVDAAVGMGFGVLASSFMIAAGVAPAVVVATVNIAKVGNGLFSAISHASLGNVRWRWVLPLALPGIVGAVIGAIVLVKVFNDTAKVA
ncbi:MAG TPA: TSUP family transporter, partial [Kofleriaceae bacterium]